MGVQRHRITFEERGASGDGDKRFTAWPHVEAGAVHNFDPGCESTTTTPVCQSCDVLKKMLFNFQQCFQQCAFNLNPAVVLLSLRRYAEGSKVSLDLPSYPLPNGLYGHFYDKGSDTIDEVSSGVAEPPDRPTTLAVRAVMQKLVEVHYVGSVGHGVSVGHGD